ncbi:MAG: sigma-70 family RNA polymerase sigma factor [Armatimonadetes bacterium]|nr:sigma-70 family RNA polymerase sigma factor [Armatimonadota bacterium]
MLLQTDERELIRRCQLGDREAFGVLFDRYERPVYRYAYHILGDPDEADDIKQDTFVKAYRTLPGFRGECSLLTWLLKIAGNLCRDKIKSRARRSEVGLVPEIEATLFDNGSYGADPAIEVERREMTTTVHRVLSGLPQPQRELIVLRDLQGLSYQEIAQVLNCSVASVKLRLFRARRGFKDRFVSLTNTR